ncbi:MAG TPA: UpxY family transcription antiterminator [Candidatus Acidoferrum sp.]|nr:UpxY family transcription antiterminator [Candidatus Acidoferrum sp.]
MNEGLIGPGHWYAVYTKHQHEKNAADLLRNRGFEVFLPLLKETRRWKDRSKQISLPIFPCYLFLRLIEVCKVEILQTPGVFWMVESVGRPCPIPDWEIEGIRKVAEAGMKIQSHPYLTCGTEVRVSRGSLAGLTGILIRVKNETRVVVSLKLLQKAVSVEVDRSDLEDVSGQNARALSSRQIRN